MTATIPRNIPVDTWGLPLTEDERAEGVAAVTVFWPEGKTAVFLLMECADDTVVVGHQATAAAHLPRFDLGLYVENARMRAMKTLRYLKDQRRVRQEQRARELAGEPL